MEIARQRVQYPAAPKRRPQSHRVPGQPSNGGNDQQKIDEFINQKKEMFRVQLAYNTLQEEISALDQQQCQRQKALVTSSEELERDKQGVILFVEKNNITRQQKEEEEKS